MTVLRRSGAVMLTVAALAGCSTSSPGGASSRSGSTPPSAGPSSSPATSPPPAAKPVARVVAHLPYPTSRAVLLATSGGLTLIGGLTTGDVTTGRVDIDGSADTAAPSLAEPVHDASGAVLHGHATVFGGGAAVEMADVQQLNGQAWHVVGRLPQPRSDSASATIGDTAYVVGGYDGSALPREVLATTDGRSFKVVGRLRIGVRYPAVAASGSAVFVIGGDLSATTSSSGGPQTDDIQRFDTATGKTTVIGHLPKPMGHAMAFVLGGDLFVAGGRSGTTAQSAILRIDPVSGAVTRVGRLPYAVSDAATALSGSSAYLAGGETTGPLSPLSTLTRVTLR